MRVLQIYNRYRMVGHGEDRVVDQTASVLRAGGADVAALEDDSRRLTFSQVAKFQAALTSSFNPNSYRRARAAIAIFKPDVVHAHNLYPLLTPSVLKASRDAGVATVITAHNYYLTCPVYTHLYEGQTCVRCMQGAVHNCILRNCRNNLLESIVYASRSFLVRKLRLIDANMCRLIALSEFAALHFEKSGIAANRISVLPNAVPVPAVAASPGEGQYVAFGGRLTFAKGTDILIDAAAQSGLPVQIAGSLSSADVKITQVAGNVTFLGQLSRVHLHQFYLGAKFLVFPSRWFEMCPMMILEAMSYGLPVIASNVGGIRELIVDGESGILVEPGNSIELAASMRRLWDNPAECRRLGSAARARIRSEFDESIYFARLTEVYRSAISTGFPV